MQLHANRSFLFAPGDHARRARKALEVGADAAILDLEDAVAVAAKPAAREAVRAVLAQPRRCRAFVRVNAFGTAWCFDDLHAVASPALDSIVLPKLEDPGELVALDWMLAAIERRLSLAERTIEVMPILETAMGFARLPELAARAAALGGRVRRLAFGAGDYTLDLGLAWGCDERALDAPRAAIVLHSRAAGLEPPLDTVWIELDDAEGYAASCARSAALGFQGRLCIHPDQVDVANRAFTPSEAELARAAHRRRLRAGTGAGPGRDPGGRAFRGLPDRRAGAARAAARGAHRAARRVRAPDRLDPPAPVRARCTRTIGRRKDHGRSRTHAAGGPARD